MGDKLKHFMTIGFGTVLNIFIGLITTPIITRLVNTTDYGALSMFNTYTSIAVMVLCLGLDQALIRFYYDEDSICYKRMLITHTAGISMISTIVICLISFWILNSKYIAFEFKGKFLLCLAIYVFVQLTYRFTQLVLRVEYKTKAYALLNSANKGIYLLIVVVMLLRIKKSDNLFILIIATIIATIIPLIIGIVLEKNLWKPIVKVKNNFNTKRILKYGIPFVLSMGITTLFEALDKISINYFCDYKEVGIYASAISIVNIFTILQTTFNTVWAPMSVEHYTSNSEDTQFFKIANQIITVLMFGFGFSLLLFKDLFVLLLGQNYRSATYIIPFLIFHPIMYTLSETTSVGIDFSQKSHLHIVVAFVACISNAIGNVILVPKLGGQGAAISTGISYVVFFSMRTFLGQKYFNFRPELRKIYMLILVTVIYAFYSSFVKFNFGCVVIYVLSCLILFVLYKDTIRECAGYIIRYANNRK